MGWEEVVVVLLVTVAAGYVIVRFGWLPRPWSKRLRRRPDVPVGRLRRASRKAQDR